MMNRRGDPEESHCFHDRRVERSAVAVCAANRPAASDPEVRGIAGVAPVFEEDGLSESGRSDEPGDGGSQQLDGGRSFSICVRLFSVNFLK